MDKESEKDATEPDTQNEAWKLSALRAIIDHSIDAQRNMDDSLELFSLQDIILSKVTRRKVFEAYVKLHENLENDHETNTDSTLILKRTKIFFNDKECVFLNFRDVSTFKRLKQEEKKS